MENPRFLHDLDKTGCSAQRVKCKVRRIAVSEESAPKSAFCWRSGCSMFDVQTLLYSILHALIRYIAGY